MTEKTKSQGPNDLKVPAFAAKLKAARLAKNWSLRDLEKKGGNQLSRQTFLRAEQGAVTAENLMRIMALLSMSKTERDALVVLWHANQLKQAKAAA